jgi:hypothetical protein
MAKHHVQTCPEITPLGNDILDHLPNDKEPNSAGDFEMQTKRQLHRRNQ